MTLDNYIYSSIYLYPMLYYYKDPKKSRNCVLDHLFLTLGNGEKFNDKGFMVGSDRRKLDLPIKSKELVS